MRVSFKGDLMYLTDVTMSLLWANENEIQDEKELFQNIWMTYVFQSYESRISMNAQVRMDNIKKYYCPLE